MRSGRVCENPSRKDCLTGTLPQIDGTFQWESTCKAVREKSNPVLLAALLSFEWVNLSCRRHHHPLVTSPFWLLGSQSQPSDWNCTERHLDSGPEQLTRCLASPGCRQPLLTAHSLSVSLSNILIIYFEIWIHCIDRFPLVPPDWRIQLLAMQRRWEVVRKLFQKTMVPEAVQEVNSRQETGVEDRRLSSQRNSRPWSLQAANPVKVVSANVNTAKCSTALFVTWSPSLAELHTSQAV